MDRTRTAVGAPAPGKAYDLVLAAFVAVLPISNVASTRILVPGTVTPGAP